MSQDSNATGNVNPDIEQDSEQDLPEQIAVRLAKRERLNELGDAYPVTLPITHTIDQVRASYPDLEIDVATGDNSLDIGVVQRSCRQVETSAGTVIGKTVGVTAFVEVIVSQQCWGSGDAG